MKSKLIIFSATIATLTCLYLVKLNTEAVEFSNASVSTTFEFKEDVVTKTGVALEESKDSWKPVISRHVLKPGRENTVKGKKGTELVFPPDVFVDENGFVVRGSVVLTMEECYSVPEILRAKLSTTSDEKMLETAGMIKLTAKADGKTLSIANGKSYTIKFPRNDNPKDDFVLFYGNRNDDGIMNWTLAENELVENGATELSELQTNTPQNNEDCFIRITESYLRRDLKISEMDYFNWRFANGEGLNQWFVSGFNPDLQMVNDFCSEKLECQITFKVKETGEFDSYYISKSAGEKYDNAIVAYLQSMPPLDLEALMPKYTYEHACILTFGSHIGRDQNEIASKFRNKFSKDPNADMTNVSASDLDFYILTSSELGWINCDRFYEAESPRVDFIVQHNSDKNCTVSMVFEDINSVIKGVTDGSQTLFSGIPSGMRVRVVSIADQDGTPEMSVVRANTSDKSLRMKGYSKFSINELDMQFAARKSKEVIM